MDGRELAAVLLLGVLLPVCFARPPFLHEHPMRAHTRAWWNFAYTVFAFAAIGFVYVSAEDLLRPIRGGTLPTRSALGVAGVLLVAVACAHHVPPLITKRPRVAVACGIVGSVALGLAFGGFLAVDAIWADERDPAIAYASSATLLLLIAVAMLLYSGLSPSAQLVLYRRRRVRRRAREMKR